MEGCTEWSDFCGIKRFVYISAADFGFGRYLLQKYYEWKEAAETELMIRFPDGGVMLRPGFIYGTGTRQGKGIRIPWGNILVAPLKRFLHKNTRPEMTPPIIVNSVARVAIKAATDQISLPVSLI